MEADDEGPKVGCLPVVVPRCDAGDLVEPFLLPPLALLPLVGDFLFTGDGGDDSRGS